MVGSSSNSGNNSTGNNSSSSSSSSGMQTWQIALIICCAVLVFIVAMSALLSCYCKTRRRLVESEAHAEDANYYAVGASGAAGVGASGASAAAGIDSYGPNQRGGSAVKSGAIYGEPSSYTYTYASSAGSATPSPERAGPGPAYTSRPSSGSVGEATTPYSYRPSQSQAVTL
uniref:Uncharacterized protein n=1 Tax=Globisporangium ultimum (strain ATCC 200006 / CBS 805.95 / DAOM BR144) TaxID=431595 RepID=K3WTI9_GLOUD